MQDREGRLLALGRRGRCIEESRHEYEWAYLPGAQLIWLPTLDERAPEQLDRETPVVEIASQKCMSAD
jgi:hypothetical protein